nr:putative ribonuclease H-like domain-containing protein [Tanacetum cinerariifolium]
MVIHALKDPTWMEAMQEELLQFKLQEVWTMVDLPFRKRAIGIKWVFKNKKDKRGIMIRNKTRLVAQRYTQEEGIDYDEMDVKSAFLYEKIEEEEVYVCQPPGFEDPTFSDKVYKVEKALYELHQTPRAWVGKDFSRRVTPLFPTMMVQAQKEMGEDKAINEEMDYSLERAATTVTSLDEDEGLGEEDASKQERIANIYANEGITLVNATAKDQERNNDEEMFDTGVFDDEEVKGTVLQEPDKSTTTTTTATIPTSKVQDKAWDDVQAKIEVDYKLAQRLQVEEQDELTDVEKARLFVEFLKKIRKFFAAKRTEEKRNRPPTKAQQRSLMCTYLKNMDGWKPKALRYKSFAEIQELYNKTMKMINTFINFRTELVEESKKKDEVETTQESSSKREGYELEQERSKKQKVDDDKESEELKKCLEITLDDRDDVTMNATHLSVKSLTIVDYKIYKEGKKSYIQIFRADGNSQMYLTFNTGQDSAHMLAASKVLMLKPNEFEIWRMRIEQYIQMMDYVLWEVIENGATLPKTQVVEEMLDQTFDRLQKLVSQLELLGEKLSLEDINQKLLRSLSPEWITHAVVWRNKVAQDTMSIDDLYGNLKVYELRVKRISSSSSSTQNMAFVSSSNNSSSNTNGKINIAQAVNTANGVFTTSTQVNAAFSINIDNLSDVVICSFFASQPSSPQLVHKDLEKIHPDDMKEMDLRWECRAPRNQDNKHKESSRRSVSVKTSNSIALLSYDGLGRYD